MPAEELAKKSSDRSEGAVEALKATAPLVTFAGFAFYLLHFAASSLSIANNPTAIGSFCILAGILALSFAAGYAVKFLIYGRDALPATPRTPNFQVNPLRDRLARQVVTFGSFGIAAIAIILLVVLALTSPAKLDQVGLNVFTSILPVFSTWVGTVLAFYFTNESFRQAAESQGLLRDNSGDTDFITRPGTMVPYDRVIRLELKAEDFKAPDESAKTAAERIKLSTVRGLFQPPGVVRIIIFDNNKHPVFVVRQDLMPEALAEAAAEASRTFKDYLDKDTNRDKAMNFAWTGKMATIDDGRRLLEIRRVTDLFVTEHGRGDEQVIGWVPDESLKKVGA